MEFLSMDELSVLPSRADRVIALRTVSAVASAIVSASASSLSSSSLSSSSLSASVTAPRSGGGRKDDKIRHAEERRHDRLASLLLGDLVRSVSSGLFLFDSRGFGGAMDGSDDDDKDDDKDDDTNDDDTNDDDTNDDEEEEEEGDESVADECLGDHDEDGRKDKGEDDFAGASTRLGKNGQPERWPHKRRRQRQPDDPLGCVALLLSSHVVRCGGGGGKEPMAGEEEESNDAAAGDGDCIGGIKGWGGGAAAGGANGYDAGVRNALRIASSLILLPEEDGRGGCARRRRRRRSSHRSLGHEASSSAAAAAAATMTATTRSGETDSDATHHPSSSKESIGRLSDARDGSSDDNGKSEAMRDDNDDGGNAGDSDDDDDDRACTDGSDPDRRVRLRDAARKFDAIEKAVASLLCEAAFAVQSEKLPECRKSSTEGGDGGADGPFLRNVPSSSSPSSSRKDVIVRIIKVSSVGLVAGAIFAATGGLAAPAIAAGMAALGAGAGAVSIAAQGIVVAALFGVGGGGMAAYKMKTRTDGLGEFRVRREVPSLSSSSSAAAAAAKMCAPDAELRTTVCVSGWLTDRHDFQRPWGIVPTDPPLTDKVELLQRFYSFYDEDKVSRCSKILSEYKGKKQDQLWKELKKEYGRDPDHLFPLDEQRRGSGGGGGGVSVSLTEEEIRRISDIVKIVVAAADRPSTTHVGTVKGKAAMRSANEVGKICKLSTAAALLLRFDEARHVPAQLPGRSARHLGRKGSGKWTRVAPIGGLREPAPTRQGSSTHPAAATMAAPGKQRPTTTTTAAAAAAVRGRRTNDQRPFPRVWDFCSLYGGDMYTITWESDRLLSLCNYVAALVAKVASNASMEALQWTALASIASAVALPVAIMQASDLIDEPWTLITMRSDEAGIELADCLLKCDERRPTTLIGYSFGGRVVLSCLRELARHQDIWESQQRCRQRRQQQQLLRGDDSEDDDDDDENGAGAGRHAESVTGKVAFRYSREPASIVEAAIVMGVPAYIDRAAWAACRRVVAGRFVNCYSRTDWILKLMYQFHTATGVFRPTCGTVPISGVRGVENYDVSELVSTQQQYCVAVGDILEYIGHGEPRIAMD